MRQTNLCNEQRTRGEHEIGAEDGDDGGREAEGPVRRVHVDDREQQVSGRRKRGACDCSAVLEWVYAHILGEETDR